jgi:hypothetical protein
LGANKQNGNLTQADYANLLKINQGYVSKLMTNAKAKSYVVGIKPLELTTDGRKLINLPGTSN